MSLSLPRPVQYLPYRRARRVPNIVVDGAPLKSTVLTLSHWPNNSTPEPLKCDTSTETVFAYLDSPDWHQIVDVVSNNHFDEDGLCSMFALVDPATAFEHRELLIGAATAGDFGVYSDRTAARLCFVIEAFADAQSSPLAARIFRSCEREMVASLYREMLQLLPDMLEDVDAYREYWSEQDAHLGASEDLISSGRVSIEEIPDADLAVVRIPAAVKPKTIMRYVAREAAAVHPFAIHQATTCNRLLRIQGNRCEFQYRYESWVQLKSRRPALRVDLGGLCDRLNAIEQAAGTWRCEPVTDVVPRMYLEGAPESALPADALCDEICDYLGSAPVAWDPYDWEGP